ncbi:hypothetical protein BJ508DRAFT_418638 [Ascobolus immersus RN42]|uniref:Probable endonuclease LCL3 n=1 Tax=Ascobolus immersus RN42 TaxID=1160509 RepID=A0A3N4HRI9_ASCIM|nr:hypothetical protein BJ508DRAFT_418638 [Ascobolus immersus RN42]
MATMEPFKKGIVKSVLSGDTVTLQSTVTVEGESEPYEKQFSLAYVSAPRLRREGDEPWAFQSREYVRNSVLNKEVRFKTAYTTTTNQREYGIIALNDGANLAERLIEEGLVTVRQEAGRKDDPEEITEILQRYRDLETIAKAERKGIHSGDSAVVECNNDFPTETEDFFKKWGKKRMEAIVERVLTGDRIVVRLFLTPTLHQHAAMAVAGVRTPATARNGEPAEEFGDQAKQFADDRLTQQKIAVELVGCTQQNFLIGKVWIGKTSFAESLLSDGLARVNDQHISYVGSDITKLRSAEGQAKAKKLRIWKNFVPKKIEGGVECVVTRVWNGDTLTVKRTQGGSERKISLSSIRAPKVIPNVISEEFANEAKEFMRKRLIGKTVIVRIDGRKESDDKKFESKDVATVIKDGKNVALSLVEAGYAKVIYHKHDDTDRSPDYDDLRLAADQAEAAKRGIYSGKETVKEFPELVPNKDQVHKAKIQLPGLVRQGRVSGFVDYVAAGGRFKVVIPKEGYKITFLLAGLQVPKTARSSSEVSDPFGDDAAKFAMDKLMQRDVTVEFESIDKIGGFIGTIWTPDNKNFSEELLLRGFAKLHTYSAERSKYASVLFAAEERARAGRIGLWHNYVEPTEEEVLVEATVNLDLDKRPLDYRNVEVTSVLPDGRMKLQINHPQYTGALATLQSSLRKFKIEPFTDAPRRNTYVVARFSEDKQLYRARITSFDKATAQVQVNYIDYGNTELLPLSALFKLPEEYSISKLRPQAIDAVLSFIQFPAQDDYLQEALDALDHFVVGRQTVANVDFEDKKEGVMYVTLYENAEKDVHDSINAELLRLGNVMLARKPRRWEQSPAFKQIVAELKKSEDEAKDARTGIWEYGDLTED